MKEKHIEARIAGCLVLAGLSSCPRRKFGAMIVDPERNTVLAEGYNGGPRGAAGDLCAGHACERDGVVSGTRMELGCHHAEANAICNAAFTGTSLRGAWLFITGEPCPMCAKLVHHAGISKVVCVKGGYSGGGDGVAYLKRNGVAVRYVDGPQDPRLQPISS